MPEGLSAVSQQYDAGSVKDDIQEVIALKIALREEIKTELRAEFTALLDGARGVSDARYEGVKDAIAASTREMERHLSDADKRYQDRHSTLQDRVTEGLASADRLTKAMMEAADRAVSKAEAAHERRLDIMNEWRGSLADQSATLLPRTEADARFNALSEKVSSIREDVSVSGGKSANSTQITTWGIGAAAIIISLGVALWNHTPPPTGIADNGKRLDDLISQNNEQNRLMSARLDALSARINQGQVQPR